MLSLCPFDISVCVGAFVIGLGQISSFLSLCHICRVLRHVSFHFTQETTIQEYKSGKKNFLADKEICKGKANLNSMLQEAKRKSYPSKLKTPDQLAAARMVNLYTQGAGDGCFYRALNAQLRNGKPSKTYKDYAQLLNDAIDMLGPILNKGTKFFGLSSSYAKTFRGTGTCDEITKTGPATTESIYQYVHQTPAFLLVSTVTITFCSRT